MAFDVKLYFSGSVDHEVSEYLLDNDVHRLFTFAYPKEVFEYLDAANAKGIRCRIMMDSGAFTAWNIGKPVQLENLMAYNDEVLRLYGAQHDFVFISLDVIPGERGRRPTSEELFQSVCRSYDNYLVMQKHYAPRYVLPVYHSGEDVSLRNAYLNLTDYVALSMDQTMSEVNRLEWAKRASLPGFKYHGLAATGNRMVTQIPWFSADSSSWVTVGSMGNILWPTSSGEFRVLPISHDSPNRHDAGNHLTTLTHAERTAAEAKIHALGFDPQKLATEYRERWRWNIKQWCNPPWQTSVVRPVDLFS